MPTDEIISEVWLISSRYSVIFSCGIVRDQGFFPQISDDPVGRGHCVRKKCEDIWGLGNSEWAGCEM